MAKSKFVYRGDKRTVESVVRKSKQSGGAYDSYLTSEVQLLKVKEGESTVRILPPSWSEKDDEKWGDGWDIQVFLHYSVGPDNGTYLCLDKMGNGACPICDARRQASDEERDQLKPQSRFLCWAIDRDNEKAGPQVWSMPVSVFREINLRSVDKKHNTPIPIDDPEEGYDVIFSREGSGIKTKYNAFEVGRDATPLHDDEKLQNRWLDYISEHPLPGILQFFDADHIQGVLFGKTERGADDDDDDGADRGARRPAKAGRASASDEDDYLDDKEEESTKKSTTRERSRLARTVDADEDEVDAKPVSGKDRGAATRGKSARRVESEEEEDVGDEEVEEKVSTRSNPRGGKRADPTDDEEEPDADEEDVEEESTVTRARGKLNDMKRRRSQR